MSFLIGPIAGGLVAGGVCIKYGQADVHLVADTKTRYLGLLWIL